ncbi:hypothetical protein PF010_g19214 [Phytophthora fragariae]|uniref:RxLR effector protein n=1 Tax=Phytophthora fragariae TaxID=53985 RepID=A0A6G0NC37_9STRA|nr:hypothetical protein PF010_g19214 [Phytophthora fragariae]KAE9201877.1 hypothetical protein PF004_g18586 [Phytophthora fragariae]
MRLSQVLVVAVASFLFASDTFAAATSDQAKISKVVRGSPSQRLLRSNNKLFKEEEDESEDSLDAEELGSDVEDEEDLEERSPLTAAQVSKLEKYAVKWDTTWESVAMGYSSVSKAKANALIALRDALISKESRRIQAAKMAILNANHR